MATKKSTTVSAPEDSPPQREEFSDFALVLKNGQELKCHKIKLAEVSPVFCAMLRQDCVETKTSKMKMTDFEPETVETFLDYVYSDLQLALDKELYKRSFDKKRMTSELLRMAHMYQVTNLLVKCIKHLMENVQDTNVVDIWTVAESIGNAELKKKALVYLGKKKNKLVEVPGLEESFQSSELVKSLVTFMSERMTSDDDDEAISVTVVCSHALNNHLKCSVDVQVKLSDTVETLRLLTDVSLSRHPLDGRPGCKCKKGSFLRLPFGIHLEEQRTLGSYEKEPTIIVTGSIFKCLIYSPE